MPLSPNLVEKSNSILSEALQERNLHLGFETPETTSDLKGFCPSFIKGLESFVFDIFENDSPTEMKVLAARDVNTGKPVGYICWQNIDKDEIRSWMKVFSSKGGRKALTHSEGSTQLVLAPLNAGSPQWIDQNGWIKIELMAVDPNHQGQRIGGILLAAALAFAVVHDHKSHAVLQVAGGEKNTRASNLYKRFNFDFHQGEFNLPNDNLMVLWDIKEALRGLQWEDFHLKDLEHVENHPQLTEKGTTV